MEINNKETIGNILGIVFFIPYIVLFYYLDIEGLPWWCQTLIWIFGLGFFCNCCIEFIKETKPSTKVINISSTIAMYLGLFTAYAISEEVPFYYEPWWKYIVGYLIHLIVAMLYAMVINFVLVSILLVYNAGEIINMLSDWKKHKQ